MATTPKLKLYLTDGDTKKTITENHPLAINDYKKADFETAGPSLEDAYGLPLTEAGYTSETTIYTAGN